MSTNDKTHFSPAEVAHILHHSRAYVYALIAEGRLPAMRRDGRWFVPAIEVEKRKRLRESTLQRTLKALNQ